MTRRQRHEAHHDVEIELAEWTVRVTVVAQHGRLVVKEARITLPEGDLPRGGLNADVIRRLRLGDAIAIVEERERRARSEGGSLFPKPSRPRSLDAKQRHPWVAAAYLQALREQTRSPIGYLAEKWRIDRDTARDWVHRASRAGYLTGRSERSVRAEPTDKLRAWAKEHDLTLPGEISTGDTATASDTARVRKRKK